MMKYLVIQLAFPGDVILSFGVIQKLKNYYPQAEIHLLIRNGTENLLKGHPALDFIYLLDRKKSKFQELFRLKKELNKYYFDAVINLHRFFSSGLITFAVKSNEKIGFDKNPFSFCYDKKFPHVISNPHEVSPIHEIERNHSLIAHLTDSIPERPKLYPSEADFEIVKKYLNLQPFVIIAPVSLWFTKTFPSVKWLELINLLEKRYNIILIGSKEDRLNAEKLVISKRVINLSGELTLLQSAELMKYAVRVFTNDSAPMHLASSVNAPVTAVYCSTVPGFGFGPLSDDRKIVQIQEQLSCRPCGLHGHRTCPQGHFRCASEILISDLTSGMEL